MAYRIKRGGKHPTEHRTATESLVNTATPSSDRHVSELWRFPVLLLPTIL